MGSPYEMISGPITLYYANEGTAAPEISGDPPGPWAVLGAQGKKSLSEDGVTITPDETLEGQRVLGSTAIQKLFRTEEDLMVSFGLLDISVETMARALGNGLNEVAAGSGSGGYKEVELMRGFDVNYLAVLARGKSPYGDNMNMQWWIPKVYLSFNGDVAFVKGEAAMLEIEGMVVEHSTDRFGKFQAQHAPPS